MQKTLLYFFIGTGVSFFLNYFLLATKGWELDFYYAGAFGLAWALAYYLDNEAHTMLKKLSVSFVGIIILIALGLLFFNVELAIPSVLKFSIVFVAYYVMASFRDSKSLRK